MKFMLSLQATLVHVASLCPDPVPVGIGAGREVKVRGSVTEAAAAKRGPSAWGRRLRKQPRGRESQRRFSEAGMPRGGQKRGV